MKILEQTIKISLILAILFARCETVISNTRIPSGSRCRPNFMYVVGSFGVALCAFLHSVASDFLSSALCDFGKKPSTQDATAIKAFSSTAGMNYLLNSDPVPIYECNIK